MECIAELGLEQLDTEELQLIEGGRGGLFYDLGRAFHAFMDLRDPSAGPENGFNAL